MRAIVACVVLAACGVDDERVCRADLVGGNACDPNGAGEPARCMYPAGDDKGTLDGACTPDGAGGGICRPWACLEPPCVEGDADICEALCARRVFHRAWICVPLDAAY